MSILVKNKMRSPSLQRSKQTGNDTQKYTNLTKEKERFHMEKWTKLNV